MLPVTGPAWQAMRLSRNRNWGHPELVAYVERLATESKEKDGWPGLLIGDMAQPRGGPMLSGHRSHQIGLDTDIWLMPMPDKVLSRSQREKISAISMIKSPVEINKKHWRSGHAKLIRRAASYPQVARIFVHPVIKKALCESPEAGSWLRKVRPWWGHHYHFHVRLKCPSGSQGCVNQKPPPSGRGCGKELDSWLARFRKPVKPKKPKKPGAKPKPRRQLKMADLPQACRAVLKAGDAAPGAHSAVTAAASAPVRVKAPARTVQEAPMPEHKPAPPAKQAARPIPAPTPASAPPAKAKPRSPAVAPIQAGAIAPLPAPKPKKPKIVKRRAPAVRANTDPNLPWLNSITTPLPDRAPR